MAKTQENTATQQSASASPLVTAWCVRALRRLGLSQYKMHGHHVSLISETLDLNEAQRKFFQEDWSAVTSGFHAAALLLLIHLLFITSPHHIQIFSIITSVSTPGGSLYAHGCISPFKVGTHQADAKELTQTAVSPQIYHFRIGV
ncbi:uncharacterized protein LOC117546389 isoform X2 [Gymnodraco acuticeps]|uniref:Uncharacterized protein LOC117546389 isoform X2 n=1 Tax=Gymnodraco acuticeps TaxID=8218 RepID=A0A6P8V5J4_GYMAC|nr:uncharacterized protein LOC117546389 isoform X2 [Gymnodraco acuticeps]